MDRLKLFYSVMVFTLIALIAFVGFSGIYSAITRPDASATVTTQAIVDVENLSVFIFEVSNKEGKDTNYQICSLIENETNCFWQPIKNGKSFIYKRHFQETEEKRKLIITVFKEDDSEPIENATYYV